VFSVWQVPSPFLDADINRLMTGPLKHETSNEEIGREIKV